MTGRQFLLIMLCLVCDLHGNCRTVNLAILRACFWFWFDNGFNLRPIFYHINIYLTSAIALESSNFIFFFCSQMLLRYLIVLIISNSYHICNIHLNYNDKSSNKLKLRGSSDWKSFYLKALITMPLTVVSSCFPRLKQAKYQSKQM